MPISPALRPWLRIGPPFRAVWLLIALDGSAEGVRQSIASGQAPASDLPALLAVALAVVVLVTMAVHLLLWWVLSLLWSRWQFRPLLSLWEGFLAWALAMTVSPVVWVAFEGERSPAAQWTWFVLATAIGYLEAFARAAPPAAIPTAPPPAAPTRRNP